MLENIAAKLRIDDHSIRKLVFDKYQEKASYILSPDSSKPQMSPEEYRSWCRTQEVIANNQKRIDKIMRKYGR